MTYRNLRKSCPVKMQASYDIPPYSTTVYVETCEEGRKRRKCRHRGGSVRDFTDEDCSCHTPNRKTHAVALVKFKECPVTNYSIGIQFLYNTRASKSESKGDRLFFFSWRDILWFMKINISQFFVRLKFYFQLFERVQAVKLRAAGLAKRVLMEGS